MQKFYMNLKQNFQFCKNKIVYFIENLPYYFNKIKEFCIYIIAFFKTQCKNLIAFKNMKFSLWPHEILSNAQIVLNSCITLITFTVILILIIYTSFFLDILKFLLKTIRFIVWKTPKYMIVKTTKSMIWLFKKIKWLIQNRKNFIKKQQITSAIIEEKKVEISNNNEIQKLNEKIELQYKLIKQLMEKQANEKIIKKPKINKKTKR